MLKCRYHNKPLSLNLCIQLLHIIYMNFYLMHRISEKNIENRAQQKYNHRVGTKSFARIRENLVRITLAFEYINLIFIFL